MKKMAAFSFLLFTLVFSGCGTTVNLPAHTAMIVSGQGGTFAVDVKTG